MPLPVRRLRSAALAAVAAAAAGCGQGGEVRSYTIPKPKDQPAAGGPADYRILGGMFPADDPVWFFKLTGRADALAEHVPAFDQFLSSVKLAGDKDKLPAWDLPAGWRPGAPRAFVEAAVQFGPADKPLEVTVSRAGGGVPGNLDRWARQLGLPGADPAAATKPVTTSGGAKGLRVDLAGPTNPAASGMRGPFQGGK